MNVTDSQMPINSHATVSLRQVTAETLRTILNLHVHPEQEKFVASNAVSIAQAHFSEHAWFRAIYADETPVGFIMLYDNPAEAEYFLWRFMIDQNYQGRGYGRRALELLIEHVLTRPAAKELLVSHVPAEGSPGPFYAKMGFEYTGAELGGELVMKLIL
jgi:diamine N-acetyltransferase